MKILVTFAMPPEFAVWRRNHAFRQVAHDPAPLFTAEIAGSFVRVLITGVGTDAAVRTARWALSSPADICISSGFAGALNPEFTVGSVLAPRVVRCAERELAVASDRHLLAAAGDVGARQVDRMLTSERMISSAAEKIDLAGEADAVDMESFAIMAEAARHGVRSVTIRATSDVAGVSLPFEFDRMLSPSGTFRTSALIADVLRHPQRLPALFRLARDCRYAAAQLADFLDLYLNLLNARLNLSQSEMVAAT